MHSAEEPTDTERHQRHRRLCLDLVRSHSAREDLSRSNVVTLIDALRESMEAETGWATERRKLRRTEHRRSTKKGVSPTRGERKRAD